VLSQFAKLLPIAGIAVTQVARAETTSNTEFTSRPWAAYAVAGFGTPVGLLGAVGEYTFINEFALAGGAGVSTAGLDLAVIANFRPLHWSRANQAAAFSTTLAYSTGPWESFDPDLGMSHREDANREDYFVRRAHWLQFDLGFEGRSRGGFAVRLAGGLGWMLNPGAEECRRHDGTHCDPEPVHWGTQANAPTPVVTLALGYAF
jgi:hypothetical protein